jgi:hypothetical protein
MLIASAICTQQSLIALAHKLAYNRRALTTWTVNTAQSMLLCAAVVVGGMWSLAISTTIAH